MKLFSKLGTTTWILILVVVVSCVLITLALFIQPQPVEPPPPPPPVNGGLMLDEPISATEFPYVGIKPDDTVAVFNESGEEIVIGLVHNKWIEANWSPERTHIAVLGRVGFDNDSVADLFVYELKTNEWTRGSFYSTATDSPPGISGYEWVTNDQITFSQGEIPENWIHTFDVVNLEIRKIFRVAGSLEHYQVEAERYVIKVPRFEQLTDPTFRVLNKTGSAIHLFESTDLPENYNIQTVLPGRSQNEYLVQAVSGDGAESFLWDFNTGEYELLDKTLEVDTENVEGETLSGLDITYICTLDKTLLVAVAANVLMPDSFSLLHLNPELGTSRFVAVMDPGKRWQINQLDSYCTDSETILSARHPDSEAAYGWWIYAGEELRELEAARNYTGINN